MWRELQPIPVRNEAHYGDRVVACFVERPTNLNSLLLATAVRTPDAPALIGEEGRQSYGALVNKAARIGNGLSAAGVKTGDRVALLIGNRFAFAEALLGCWFIGAICAPLNPLMRPQEIEFVLNQCGAAMVIYDHEHSSNLPDPSSTPTVRNWVEAYGDGGFEVLAQCEPMTPLSPDDAETTTLLYTSGTTGRPKGARLTHLSIIHAAMQLAYAFEMDATSRMLLAAPASHVTGLVGNIVAAWAAGAAIVVMRNFKATGALATIEAEKVSHSIMVPTMYKLCLMAPDFDQFDLSTWRCGAYGGAPMPETVIAELANRAPKLGLINTYGATEASSGHTALPASMTKNHSNSVGSVLHCSEICIMNDEGIEVSTGEIGEIWMRGGNISPGYWNNPEADSANFIGGFWRSGDIGRVDENGLIYVLDRKKDMLNRGGYKIYSSEVENQLSFHPATIECAVIAKPCDVMGERVRAIIVTDTLHSDNEPALAADIQAFAAQRLSKYKVPEEIFFRQAPLPRNANGKVLKNVLREEYKGK
jgi:long-chain acyl-CoA synthetase